MGVRVALDWQRECCSQVPSAAAQLPDSVDTAGVTDELTGPRVSHLPPVCLCLRFPGDYPSAVMPAVQLSALWLTADTAQMLLDRLEDLWHEQVHQHNTCIAAPPAMSCLSASRIRYYTRAEPSSAQKPGSTLQTSLRCRQMLVVCKLASCDMPHQQPSMVTMRTSAKQQGTVTHTCHVQGPGLPVTYTWAEWLQTSALEALGYSTSLPVPRIATASKTAAAAPVDVTADAATSSAAADSAQIALEPGPRSWEMLLVQLLQFDASRDFQLFQEVCTVVFVPILAQLSVDTIWLEMPVQVLKCRSCQMLVCRLPVLQCLLD